MLAWLAATLAPFPEFDPWKAKERWSDLPTFENIVKECMLSYDHFFDFDRDRAQIGVTRKKTSIYMGHSENRGPGFDSLKSIRNRASEGLGG